MLQDRTVLRTPENQAARSKSAGGGRSGSRTWSGVGAVFSVIGGFSSPGVQGVQGGSVGACLPRALDDHGAGRCSRGSRASSDDTLTDAVLHPARLHELLVPGQVARLLPVIQQHLRRAVLVLGSPSGTRGLAGALH